MESIKVGIIGTGFGLNVLVPIFDLQKGYEVVAIASVYRLQNDQPDETKQVHRKIYSNWIEMLEREALDLVVVASAPPLHKEMTKFALEKGFHVFCEKPMGMTAKETAEMLTLQNGSDRIGIVDFHWRFAAARMKIYEILRSGKLGEIQYIDYCGSFSGMSLLQSRARGWEGKAEQGGGMLFAVGSHMIDSLLWWMKEKIVDVCANLEVRVPQYAENGKIECRNAEDSFAVSGHFEQGARFRLDLFYPAVRGKGWELLIYGTEGTLRMTYDRDLDISFGGDFQSVEVQRDPVPAELPSDAVPYYESLCPMLTTLERSMKKGNPELHLPTFAEAHRVQQVMDAIFDSDKKKRVIFIQ